MLLPTVTDDLLYVVRISADKDVKCTVSISCFDVDFCDDAIDRLVSKTSLVNFTHTQ